MNFSVKTLLMKVLTRLVTLALAWASAHGLDKIGVTVDPVLATAALFGALEALRNWLKVGLKIKFIP